MSTRDVRDDLSASRKVIDAIRAPFPWFGGKRRVAPIEDTPRQRSLFGGAP